jgi:hypothetical protein
VYVTQSLLKSKCFPAHAIIIFNMSFFFFMYIYMHTFLYMKYVIVLYNLNAHSYIKRFPFVEIVNKVLGKACGETITFLYLVVYFHIAYAFFRAIFTNNYYMTRWKSDWILPNGLRPWHSCRSRFISINTNYGICIIVL